MSAGLVVIGEVSILQIALRKTYSSLNNYHIYSQRLQQSKQAKIVLNSSETEEDEDNFVDDLGAGSSSIANQSAASSINSVYAGLKRLKDKLSKNLNILTDISYLHPFCEVIKNKDISGPITGLALQSFLKFLDYGLIDHTEELGSAQLIGESVTKARFIGTDTSNDEVVLMRILYVLKEIIVRGFKCISNATVCEIMQSCFRIAFEPRLSELLRRNSEQALIDMCRVLFLRIKNFDDLSLVQGAAFKIGPSGKFISCLSPNKRSKSSKSSAFEISQPTPHSTFSSSSEFINKQGIKFSEDVTIPSPSNEIRKTRLRNYDLVCIHELLSYLTSIINPIPESQNSEANVNVGLNLLVVAFETAVEAIGQKQCLLAIVKNELCWNLLLLLQHDKMLTSFSLSIRLVFIIFTSLRVHLKYQLEALMIRLMDIITTANAQFEAREIALDYLHAFFQHITYLPHELFINYDCDPYASNLLEDILNLFSKNCFYSSFPNMASSSAPPSAHSTFLQIQKTSLNALLTCLKSLHKAELMSNNLVLKYYDVEVLQYITPAIKSGEEITLNDQSNMNTSGSVLTSIIPQHVDVEEAKVASTDEATEVIARVSLSSNSNVLTESTDVGTFQMIEEYEGLNEVRVIDSHDLKPLEAEPENEPEPKPEHIIPVIARRKPIVLNMPKNIKDIEKMKQKKKLLWMASEQFNAKPSKGINFLKENNLISSETDIVNFIRDNFKLDKKQIGEYLANKKNLSVLKAFVESFAFKGLRIDEALRMYLESFRLPGEAPLISLVLEQFARHWWESNDCIFVNEDAAFSLAYAIIMLNVDQHNTNVRKQNNLMTCEEFISNLRQVNGGKDFDSNMLKEIYFTIKNNEIIMPAEQHGIVREKYLWKCLLRRSETDSGLYWFANEVVPSSSSSASSSSSFSSSSCETSLAIKELLREEDGLQLILLNGPIFMILWGPALAAQTFIFDKINVNTNTGLSRKILNQGFSICALLCAKYGYLDNLIISLCKFTINSAGGPTSPLLSPKSQLAAQCLFNIAKEYVNEIRDSWSEIIKLIINWFTAKFLEEVLEFKDFALGGKKIKMKRKEKPKSLNKNSNESSSNFLSSFYSYFAGNQQDNQNQERGDTYTLQSGSGVKDGTEPDLHSSELIKTFCKPLSFIEESKFLHIDSLVELIKALINVEIEIEDEGDDVEAFRLEMLMQIILYNRDRASVFWSEVAIYLSKLPQKCAHNELLAERYVSAMFRLAIRFTPRPDSLSDQIYQLLDQMLINFEPKVFQKHYTACALHSFISHSHSSIVKTEIWKFIFNTLLYVGIGYRPIGSYETTKDSDKFGGSIESINVQSESEESVSIGKDLKPPGRGYTSDSELESHQPQHQNKSVNFEDSHQKNINPYRLMTGESIGTGKASAFKIVDIAAYEKCTEILTLIIREILPKNVVKIEDENLDESSASVSQMAVDTLRKFVEASVKIQSNHSQIKRPLSHNVNARRINIRNSNQRLRTVRDLAYDSEDELEESKEENKMGDRVTKPKLSNVTEGCALKLLDLLHYLHLNANISSEIEAQDYLWNTIWCPLLQGIALLCCDSRRPVRTCALTFLQRALLNHDLKILSAHQWESCFNKVLFPLLAKLLEPLNICDPIGMDETRMRATNLLCKVFLQHLTPLLNLPTFTALWLTILDFMDKYMKAEMQTDLVKEAIPESLKNMLLVMDTANCLNGALLSITWDRIHSFLPNLKDELQ